MWGRDSYGVWDGYVHTDIFKVDNQQGFTVELIGLCCVMWQPGWEGSLGRMDTCICMAESLCCSLGTITLLIGYTSI